MGGDRSDLLVEGAEIEKHGDRFFSGPDHLLLDGIIEVIRPSAIGEAYPLFSIASFEPLGFETNGHETNRCPAQGSRIIGIVERYFLRK